MTPNFVTMAKTAEPRLKRSPVGIFAFRTQAGVVLFGSDWVTQNDVRIERVTTAVQYYPTATAKELRGRKRLPYFTQ